jgi:predicted nucleic acid-binding protein
MILYLDTSALVKRYFREPYSDDVISETMASMYQKKREDGLPDKLIRKTAGTFQRDWESFIRVEVNDALNRYIDRAVNRYPLRGFDAVHLASAMVLYERLPEDFLFACFDEVLSHAAGSEGFETFPPTK